MEHGAAHWLSLVAPLAAVLLAIFTGRVRTALLAGTVLGAALYFGPVSGPLRVVREYLLNSLISGSHPYIIGFTMLVLSSVRLSVESGAIAALMNRLRRHLETTRQVKTYTATLGLVVFFDDYANSMLVGPAMQPICDRCRVSREKLAYLIDSTAAPVAGLALLSTWVGYEVGLLGDVGQSFGWGDNPYEVLVRALPYRFYCVFALVLVFASCWLERDFGAMHQAEKRALGTSREARPENAIPEGRATAREAWLPLLVLLVVTPLGFVFDGGWGELRDNPWLFFHWSFLRHAVFASEHNVQVLFIASVIMSCVALSLSVLGGAFSLRSAARVFGRGLQQGAEPISILVLAWALASVCHDLGTGPFLAQLLEGRFWPSAVPVVTFLVAAATAFATGTSWATMAIILPAAVPWAHQAGGEGVALITAASVMDGAIFGDHCSPISDTTVISAAAAGCDLVAHVKTQLPYALVAMGVAALVGYLPTATLGLPPLVAYLLGGLAVVAVLLVRGRPLHGSEPRRADEDKKTAA